MKRQIPVSLTVSVSAAADRIGISGRMIRRKAFSGVIAGAFRDEYGFWRIPASWDYVPLRRGRPKNGRPSDT
jgi:hypothetical protein